MEQRKNRAALTRAESEEEGLLEVEARKGKDLRMRGSAPGYEEQVRERPGGGLGRGTGE